MSGFTPIQATRVVQTALALLERDTSLAATVWRNAAGDFAGAKDETISIRLPAYAVANRRTLRANDTRVRSTLNQRKVDVTLTEDLQVDVPLTDENLTLDVESLARDVVAPAMSGIVRGYEETIATLMQSAVYDSVVGWDASSPYDTLVDARLALDAASVPANDRFLVVGSDLAGNLLKQDLLVQANTSGSTQTLRRGVIGEVASFTVLTSPFVAPDFGVAYHRTAFALANRAPVVPQGVAWGQSLSAGGFAIRVMQHLGQNGSGDLENLVYHDGWVGANTVSDAGAFNTDGQFVPSVTPDSGGSDLLFVRAVGLGAVSSS